MRNAPLILPAALVLTACAATPDMTTGTTVVNVTATYRERIMLPPGHVLTVRVEDVSLADAPAKIIAETSASEYAWRGESRRGDGFLPCIG